MNKILIVVIFLTIISACSGTRSKPLSDSELADLAKNFDLDRDELKKFRPTPIVEKFEVQNQDNAKELRHEQKLNQPNSIDNEKAKTTKAKDRKSKNKEKVKVEDKVASKKSNDVNSEVNPTNEPQTENVDVFKDQDVKSAKFWPSFEPRIDIGEAQVIKIKYLGITVGNITLNVMPSVIVGGVEAYHFRGLLQSSSYYEMLYKLDDVIESFVSKEKFLPIKYFLAQRESGKNIDDLQLFDHEKRKTYTWYKKEKKGEISKSEKQGDIPVHFQDGFSALYFIRGLPLIKGDHYEIPIITKAKIYFAKIDVVGTEKIHVLGKNFDAVKVRATNQIPGVDDKKDDVVLWFSNDNTRLLLKFNTKIKLGTVEGELVEYRK